MTKKWRKKKDRRRDENRVTLKIFDEFLARRGGRKKRLTTHDGRADREKMNTGGPSPLAHQRHVVGIAAKQGDVLVDPLERRDLIHQPVIRDPRLGLGRHVGVEKAEHAQPVVHRHDYLVCVAGQHAAIVRISATPVVALPVDVQQHRMLSTVVVRHPCEEKGILSPSSRVKKKIKPSCWWKVVGIFFYQISFRKSTSQAPLAFSKFISLRVCNDLRCYVSSYLFIFFFFHNRSKLVVSTARASHIGQCLANDRERKTIAQRTLCSFKVPFIALRRQIVSTKDDIVPGETSVNDLRPREGNEREKWREYIERERGRDATLGELTFVADMTGR